MEEENKKFFPKINKKISDFLYEEEGNIALTFQHPLEVLRHLKYTGVTANASRVWTRGKQERFCRDYQERFPSADGGVTLTYRPLYILVVKR